MSLSNDPRTPLLHVMSFSTKKSAWDAKRVSQYRRVVRSVSALLSPNPKVLN